LKKNKKHDNYHTVEYSHHRGNRGLTKIAVTVEQRKNNEGDTFFRVDGPKEKERKKDGVAAATQRAG